MKPWNDLSERAKDLDRCTIRSVLDALNAPAPHAEQCTCGMSEATEPEYHAKDCAYYVDPSPIVEIPGIDYPAPQYVSR